MKTNRTKSVLSKRIMALILSAAMILTMMPAMVFADTAGSAEDTTKLLVFGASTSSGYGHADFVRYCKGYSPKSNDLGYEETDDFGLSNPNGEWTVEAAEKEKSGRISRYSYPWKLKEYIAVQDHNSDLSKVNLNAMTLSGMRSNELHAFLDPEYYAEAYDVENRLTRYEWKDSDGKDRVQIGFLTSHIEEYIEAFTHTGAIQNEDESYLPGTGGYQAAHDYVTEEIKGADVIVLDIANNSFGTYLCERIVSGFGLPGQKYATNYGKQTIEDIVGASPVAKNMAKTIEDTLTSNVGMLNDPAIKAILDAFIYCFVDCLSNFTAVTNEIKALNPDAKIVVLGTFNTLNGVNIVMGDTKVDVGKVTSVVYEAVNTYLKAVDPNSNSYYYADAFNADIETFMDQIYSAETLQDLIGTDGSGKELSPGGANIMDCLYNSFRDDYMGGLITSQAKEAAAKQYYETNLKATYGVEWDQLPAENKTAIIDQVWAGMTDEQKDYVTGLVVQQVDQNYKPAVMQLLFAAGHVTDVNMGEILATMGGGMDAVANELMGCIATSTMPSDSTMQLIQIIERFLLFNSVGLHPSVVGCDSMYQSVKTAYDKAVNGGNTAYRDTVEMIGYELGAVVEMLRSTGAKDDIDAIIAKLAKIKKAMDMLDAAEPYIDAAVEYEKQFEEVMNQTLELLGLTTDDVLNQAKAVMKSLEGADIEQIAKSLKYLDECVRKMPETTNQVIAQIRKVESKVDMIKEMLEEAGLLKSNEILDELKALAAKLAAAETKEDYMKIVSQLTPIGEELLKIGSAVADLPEYEAAVNEYMYVSKTAISNLETRMTTVEKNIAMLTARAVDSKFSTKVTFSGGKANITLSVKSSDLADGYTLLLNGKKVNYSIKGGKLVYTVNNAKIGSKYKFSLTPYVVYDDGSNTEKIDGNTTTKTVTPKVSLKKASVKSAKGGKKSVTVKWAKVKDADGYKITCKAGSKTKTVTVKGGSKVSKKITGLASGSKYSVKVRAYKKVNGKTYYGSWSAAKKAKVK